MLIRLANSYLIFRPARHYGSGLLNLTTMEPGRSGSHAAPVSSISNPNIGGIDDDIGQLKLRSYQQEMVEESMKRNVIVAMDTGSGKTQIAVSRARSVLETCSEDKIVWLLAPTVALCEQHLEVFNTHLPAYQTRRLTGSDGIDSWSSQDIWDKALLNVRNVISTHAILRDALTHGFVQMSRIALLVFDEAHHCVKDHPARQIMSTFYMPSLLQNNEELPCILGLTASPINSHALEDMATLEANMNARVISPKVFRTELLKYVYRPELLKSVYSNSGLIAKCELLRKLLLLYIDYNITEDPWYLSIQDFQKRLKLLMNKKTYCHKQLQTFYNNTDKIQQELGTFAAEWYIITCVKRLIDVTDAQIQLFLNTTIEEKVHLTRILAQLQPSFPDLSVPAMVNDGSYSAKVNQLVQVLEDEWSPSFRGIIFVERRAVVHTLVGILSTHPSLADKYSIEGFVGNSSYSKRKKEISELAERDQGTALEDFRAGKVNLMIATSVLEEGIDVPHCHIVICFDKPANLKAYIQRRGRARKKKSKYVMMLASDDVDNKEQSWARLEKAMEAAYLDDMRAVQEAKLREMEDETMEKEFRTLKAVLTIDGAVSHLYHFCATLNAGPFVDLRPTFAFDWDPEEKYVTATVALPTIIEPSLRTASSTGAIRTEKLARKDAAFEAYVALYKAGLVNENLMPLIKGPEVAVTREEAQASTRSVRTRINPWVAAAAVASQQGPDNQQYYRAKITIEGLNASSILFSPIPISHVPSFTLYWNRSVQYIVIIESSPDGPFPQSRDSVQEAQKISNRIYYPGHMSRMKPDGTFLLLISPSPKDIPLWAREVLPEKPLPNDLSDARGIVRHLVDGGGARYFFNRLVTRGTGSEKTIDGVMVTKIPKRRDFLHPVANLDVLESRPAKEDFLPIGECAFDQTPLDYCTLSFLIPSILRRIELALVAEQLRTTVLKNIDIKDLTLVQTAITHTSAREAEDYQRLEFLGDCILKYYTSLQLIAEHPNWPEGYLAQAKDHRVCNSALETACRQVGLEKFIIADVFTGAKWHPHYIEELVELGNQPEQMIERSSKMLADVVESLIGASYLDGSLPKALQCIELFFPGQNWRTSVDALSIIYDSAISSDTVHLEGLERLIGYGFNNSKLLLEAITHASFQSFHGATARTYEILEFLGDSVLDYLVVRRLFRHHVALPHPQLHAIRTATVNSWILGFLCMEHSVAEEVNEIVQSANNTVEARPQLVRRHIWQYMRHSQPPITALQSKMQEKYATMREDIILQLDTSSRYPWSVLARYGPEKVYSDLIESLIGAIFVDTHGDFEACDSFLDRIGLWTLLNRILDENVDCLHPKERLGHLAVSDKVAYVKRFDAESGKWKCQVQVGGKDVGGEVEGFLKVDVEAEAATRAVEILELKEKGSGSGSGLKRQAEGEVDVVRLEKEGRIE
ncbi:P-loop containing nucleoside triphosphate hydrolase protein [Tothia fuscella]|uniref:P-loop containing nucleoside triphosphate hydrolase protein n=1 Tax=Tothia fuscella TaxID=1048955 RepID=A0A9P4NUR2_9PEZI|nr:P-loop containing nucleoside triphosphate hydrolase protein [Tothia fuscella]